MQKPILVYADQPIIASDSPATSQIPITDANGNLNLKGMLSPTGPVSAGSFTLTPVTVTASGSIGTYTYVRINATSGANTQTLPPAATVSGLTYELFRTDATGNTVTIATTGSETINGATTYTGLSSQYSHAKIRSNGTGWDIVG